MTEIVYRPNPLQIFNRTALTQSSIGYLTKLNIGSDATLTADIGVARPDDGSTVNAVAALSEISWGGGPGDPLRVAGLISTTNKKTIGNISPQSLSNTEVVLQFSVFSFDQDANSWFQAFHTGDEDVKGFVKTREAGSRGFDLELKFDTEPAREPQSPQVFRFEATLVPKGEEMSLHVATANLQVIVKTWGIAPPS